MSGWNSRISLWTTPIASAAATVIPNDENRPTRAAASAGSTATDSTAALRVTIGARRMAARADSPPAIGEVDQLDAVRRPTGAGRHPAVLGDGGGGEAEQRAGVDEAQHGGAGQGDPDEHQAVHADAEVAPQRDVVRRQQRLGLHDPDAPAQDHERLAGAEQAEGGDELRQPRGVAERATARRRSGPRAAPRRRGRRRRRRRWGRRHGCRSSSRRRCRRRRRR